MSEIIREHFQLKETIVTISAKEAGHIDAAKEAIRSQRAYLEEFIRSDPFFQITLEPYDLYSRPGGTGRAEAPAIVRWMVETSSVFHVGPMAAVAGAIAGFAVSAMIEEGAAYAVVDNGGDICILNDQPLLVGIYAGPSPIRDLAFQLPARERPVGICTSSGTVGPSISFGFADAAVAVSRDVALADAAATALGNAVTVSGPLEECFSVVDRPGIEGALLIRGDRMAMWRDLPPLRRVHVGAERITRG
ncbi:MAG TPA: UPF0280 family protein [Methanothrix sp.]|nr:UPF0280 family protein [Methanothrix sp.]HOV81504.1 UPF0280 family protein [Methanothrix sp.]HPC89462.1 UPF0280 family protein [Methanothrix sp.]HQE87220.1 UPF0280 family protein [Methanothrix sp.]HQI68660.1 UPF0280 family protein [Methanothrix sp.]